MCKLRAGEGMAKAKKESSSALADPACAPEWTEILRQMIFIRRTDDTGHVHLLGQRLAVSPNWLHRLVRCEVDFDHHCIRCFALRRAVPTEQPLLTTIPYQRPDKPFKGEL